MIQNAASQPGRIKKTRIQLQAVIKKHRPMTAMQLTLLWNQIRAFI